MKFGFGVDLGGTTVKIAYFDEQGTMLAKWEIPTVTDNAGAGILPDMPPRFWAIWKRKTLQSRLFWASVSACPARWMQPALYRPVIIWVGEIPMW